MRENLVDVMDLSLVGLEIITTWKEVYRVHLEILFAVAGSTRASQICYQVGYELLSKSLKIWPAMGTPASVSRAPGGKKPMVMAFLECIV